MWENLDKTRPDSAHYSILRRRTDVSGMDALREMFPSAEADPLNFVLFSTSGAHGTYNTIEEAEKFLSEEGSGGTNNVTFLIVHPRLVALRYAVCAPMSQKDIEYLKRLRDSSHKAIARIGMWYVARATTPTLKTLATQLAEAVLKDEAPEEGGFDLSAGLFGRHVSEWLQEVAKKLDDQQPME